MIKKAISRLFKGVAKGTGEATLIPSIVREVGGIVKNKNIAKYGNNFDLNTGRKLAMENSSLKPWETMGKMLGILIMLIIAERFKVLDYFIYVLHAINEYLSAPTIPEIMG